ncbi:RND efflux system, membrane fusion protein CmeA [Klebsiella pneumoniae]|nr:RND efflux system, membrane fusion protein CmeA [Klebsiella pneumoniae]
MSKFFIHRPVFAWVLAIIMMIAGGLAILQLPIAQYPTIAPPAVAISATYPGADAQTVQDTVTQVIEQNMNGIDNLMYMSSTSDSAGSSDALATVQQLDPIYVDVTESSNDFMRLKQESLQRGGDTKSVELVMENGQAYPLKGSLQFSDVTVDESTGSITLRAIFPNPQHVLLPGMFVRARIDEGVDPQAILVPQQGVTRTPRGDASVMLVNDKNQVETREVVATQAVGDKWLITSGLKPGDKVIVSGLQKVRPGVTVKAEVERAAPAVQ